MSSNSLVQRLLNARDQSWSVSQAVDHAIQLCGLDRDDKEHSSLVQALDLVVEAVEMDGQRLDQLGLELPYHNRAHVVDALTSLSCLMQASLQLSAKHKWIALIAMAGHDLGHRGKTNEELLAKQEEITADWVVRRCLGGLPQEQSALVRRLIELTDPARVRLNHFAYRKKSGDELLLLQVLINEADIAASMVPQLSVGLTSALLRERGNHSPSAQEVAELYGDFKKSCVLSSDAANLFLSANALREK